MSEYEREDGEGNRTGREYEEGSENGENLEEIISQLLQNKLQLQKLLLSKQRRGLMRKLPLRYETSDTENEDGPFKANGSYAGSDAGDTLRHEDVGDYVDFYFNGMGKEGECATHTESANVSSSECQSIYSSAVSVHQTCDNKSLSSEKKTKPVRRSSSDLSFKKMPTLKKMNSNYDNLLNIWSTIRGKSPEKRQSGAFQQAKTSQTPTATLERPRLRRAQSFSAEKCLSNNHENIYVSAAQLTPQPHTAPAETSKPPEVWVRDESPRENRERPVTIAFYNSNEVSLSALEQYLNQPRPPRRCSERFPYDTEDNMTDYSMTPHMSMDNILSIHPEHKIYKSTNNKSTLKTVLNKITSPRNNKTVSEPSGSVYNYSIESELDKGVDKRASKMVYNMARQCSKTLKERIKQIRAEDIEKAPVPKSPTENVYALPMYKQGSSSIGARLAGTNEPSDYAVPRIRPLDQKPNDASADSYYERSFEAIENLETEIFRDSAIYSDPEDTESPPNSLNQERPSTSPKSKTPNSKKFSPRSSTKVTKKAVSPSRHASPEIVVTPEESSAAAEAESTSSSGVASISPRSSPQSKKVPPPVPAKPDSIKTKRPCGNLIMQQLKNLEECTKSSRDDQNSSPSFDGFRSLDDRRKELEVCRFKGDDGEEPSTSPRGTPERENSADRSSRSPRSPSLMTPPIIKNPITLSPLSLPVTRSSSVPPRLSPRPSLTPESPLPASVGTQSPAGSERASPLPPTCQDVEELDEPRVARVVYKDGGPELSSPVNRDTFQPSRTCAPAIHPPPRHQSSSAQTPAPYTHAANPALPPPPRTPPTPSFRTHAPREPPSLLQTMVSTARAAAVVMAVAVVSAARLAHAAVLPGHDSSGSKLVSPRNEYMHDLNPELVSLLQQTLPEIRDIRIVDGPDGPRLDMPLSGCRDSLDCHHRFTNYLGLLVRMMETGKRRK
ncbi:hypothetical protein C7M84_014682 [Penaeus vannamei]|uniref:Uncharacterized protein n=2 Tax=Penaeus TaxID=133894 RepID=A0A3R7LZ74_PENVA|nr:hypothetical protein C7M84_014682 [Penaeus vannamei]